MSQEQENTSNEETVDKTQEDTITIKVAEGNGGELQFKIKKSTPMEKVMNAYIKRLGAQPGSLRFLFDGNRVQEKDTVETLDMEDGDTIDVMITQTGGYAKINRQYLELHAVDILPDVNSIPKLELGTVALISNNKVLCILPFSNICQISNQEDNNNNQVEDKLYIKKDILNLIDGMVVGRENRDLYINFNFIKQ